MNTNPRLKILAVGATCAALGAGAGVLNGASAASHGTKANAAKKTGTQAAAANGGAARRFLKRTVHAELVVPKGDGTFGTVTIDRGTVQSVSGDQLVLAEGTKKAAYKTVTLTIPAGAKVRDDKKAASLGDVKAGQKTAVIQAPKRTFVIARDAKR